MPFRRLKLVCRPRARRAEEIPSRCAAKSSIDTHTEILVQQGIEKLLKGRTSFVIAHRLSTIQNADRIFVVDKGGIIESGTPRELIAKRGIYYDLYMAQFKEVS